MKREEKTKLRRWFRRWLPTALLLAATAGLLLGLAELRKQPPPQTDPAPELRGETAPAQPPEAETPAEPVAPQEDWALILVNRTHPLPEEFELPQRTVLRGEHEVDSRILEDLQQMMDDARAEGLEPLICSAWRSREEQAALFEAKTEEYLARGLGQARAEELASGWVSPPGCSEHETGLALDVVDMANQLLDESQESTPTQQWLLAHSWEYGFILRYPTDKSVVTGVQYEPWHYRYVGRAAAKEIAEGGLTLEEYLGVEGVYGGN